MPKQHINQANDIVRTRYAAKLQNGGTIRNGRGQHIAHSAALAWREAFTYAQTCGFDTDPPATPVTAEYDRLLAENSPLLHEFRRTHAIDLDEERRAATAWAAMRRWASEPSEEERTEAARQECARAARELAIDARTFELVSQQEEKRFQTARKQAERELAS